MEAKVILFHSNESDKCKAFINNDVSLITSKNGKDDIWLGDGMYFWVLLKSIRNTRVLSRLCLLV